MGGPVTTVPQRPMAEIIARLREIGAHAAAWLATPPELRPPHTAWRVRPPTVLCTVDDCCHPISIDHGPFPGLYHKPVPGETWYRYEHAAEARADADARIAARDNPTP